MEPVITTADGLSEILQSLGARAVITKNKDPELERNYRERPGHPLDMLDGYWAGTPAKINPSDGYAIHLVEHRRRVWLGDYGGVREDEGKDRISLIVRNARCFEITDLDFKDARQRVLKSIFKQRGAVIYSYHPR
jgi:hypothetical protein